jgi:hypothetical protein
MGDVPTANERSALAGAVRPRASRWANTALLSFGTLPEMLERIGSTSAVESSRGSEQPHRRAVSREAVLLLAAPALYLMAAGLLLVFGPGLQYDEALLQRGTVQMLRGNAPGFAVEPFAWVNIGDRAYPLMFMPYGGGAKYYLLLLPFALFGPEPFVGRLLSAALGAFGVWGLGRGLAPAIGVRPAAAASLLLAAAPSYVMFTLFDNTGTALFMATVGSALLAFGRFFVRRDGSSAFLFGAALGFAVWGRLNFVWLLGGVGVAALVVARSGIAVLLRRFLPFLAGGVAGGAPLLFYEIRSKGETFRFMKTVNVPGTLADHARYRLGSVSQALFSAHEQRSIWGGAPDTTVLENAIAWALLSSIALALLLPRREGEDARFRRGAAIAFLVLAAFLVTSGMDVQQRHLLTTVPAAVVCAALVGVELWRRLPPLRPLVVMFVLAEAVALARHYGAAVQALHRTGGVGPWSDAVETVARYVTERHPGRPLYMLTWGLTNNLFVLTGGEAIGSDLFWGATDERTAGGGTWDEVLSGGGVFLRFVGETQPGRAGFEAALARLGRPYKRVLFRERSGEPFVELFDVPGPTR